ncbi:CoA transferase, partial [Neobacillus sp. YIM B02564]|nr:CoA transferase [Neobacillus paridis]
LCASLDDARLAYSFIYSIEDIMHDPHYQARGTIASVPDPRIGPVKMAGVIPKFPDREEKPIEPAPDLGQHNHEIYCDLLGLSAEELSALAEADVI